MTSEKGSCNPLEQFVLLAKSAKGAAALELIKQTLEAPGVYVFGELLVMPSIQELAAGDGAKYYHLLNLFAYGTYKDYKAKKSELPELSTQMLNKLRHLTMVSLATKSKRIPYKVLLEELDVSNLRTLEDLIIEVIYADIIHGKLDQKNQQLEVDYAIGRDIRPESVADIVTVLSDWYGIECLIKCSGCEAVLHGIETQITKANLNKENNLRLKQNTEQEIINIKKTLKSTHAEEESMVTESVSITSDKPTKKASKTKG